MTEVAIPTILRQYTDGQKRVEATGATLRELLAELEAAHPGLGARVTNPDGTLLRFINVYVNDEDVRFTGSLDTPIGPTDHVTILPAVAGG